jgi:hypothetical protein
MSFGDSDVSLAHVRFRLMIPLFLPDVNPQGNYEG